METVQLQAPVQTTLTDARRRFTVGDYAAMGEAGILAPDERVELLNGDVITMAPIGLPHASTIDRSVYRFFKQTGERAIIRVQSPLHLDDHSEPVPDLLLLRFRDDFYSTAHPMPADVYLLIEVSDSTLVLDRQLKLPMYAAALVPETWIIDVKAGVITQYTNPVDGVYQTVRDAKRGESLTVAALPDLTVTVDSLLGNA